MLSKIFQVLLFGFTIDITCAGESDSLLDRMITEIRQAKPVKPEFRDHLSRPKQQQEFRSNFPPFSYGYDVNLPSPLNRALGWWKSEAKDFPLLRQSLTDADPARRSVAVRMLATSLNPDDASLIARLLEDQAKAEIPWIEIYLTTSVRLTL